MKQLSLFDLSEEEKPVISALKLTLGQFSDFHDQGIISHLDYYFALACSRVDPDAPLLVLLTAALVSKHLAQGHTCLGLGKAANKAIEPDMEKPVILPDSKTWIKALKRSSLLGVEADHPKGDSHKWWAAFPLILDRDQNLYLSRYYDFQQRLILNLAQRFANEADMPDTGFIKKGVDGFFSGQNPDHTRDQRLAVEKALAQNFVLISGGPGTGKTHVTRIIQSLVEEWAAEKKQAHPLVLSLAPTGKAAARLKNGATIHSVLKPRPKGGFIHGTGNLLRADLVIVDEASMIDLALMTRLMEAIPLRAKLILLGDKNQLSPVQAGAVFTDLINLPDLEGQRAVLNHNFRSSGQKGLHLLARAVNENDTGALTRILTSGEYSDIRFEEIGNNTWDTGIIEKYVRKGYGPLESSPSPQKALKELDRFRILCAHNKGNAGTLQVNHLCEKLLRSMALDGIKGPVYKQIVMVTRNDYSKGLFNGDTGIFIEGEGGGQVYFSKEDNSKDAKTFLNFRPADIPTHEPAFAVTIHKAQGSEFDQVLILIPDRLSPVITRQLLYTGITRARSRAVIAGSLDVICQAMKSPLGRESNLAENLSQKLNPKVERDKK